MIYVTTFENNRFLRKTTFKGQKEAVCVSGQEERILEAGGVEKMGRSNGRMAGGQRTWGPLSSPPAPCSRWTLSPLPLL